MRGMSIIILSLTIGIAFTALFEWIMLQALDVLYGGKYRIENEQHKEIWISTFIVGAIPAVGLLVLMYYLWSLEFQVGSLCRIFMRGFRVDRYEDIIYRRED